MGGEVLESRMRGASRDRVPSSARRLFDLSLSSSEDETHSGNSDSEDTLVESENSSFEVEEDSRKPAAARVILEVDVAKDAFQQLSTCQKCSSGLEVSFKTLTLATHLELSCKSRGCDFVYSTKKPACARIDDWPNMRHERNTDYAVNALCVLSFVSVGDGSTEAARLLGVLGLPNDTTMEGRSFDTIEKRIAPAMHRVTDDILRSNLEEEVKVTLNNDAKYLAWIYADADNGGLPVAEYPRCSFSYDFAWQQRGTGVVYNSNVRAWRYGWW